MLAILRGSQTLQDPNPWEPSEMEENLARNINRALFAFRLCLVKEVQGDEEAAHSLSAGSHAHVPRSWARQKMTHVIVEVQIQWSRLVC